MSKYPAEALNVLGAECTTEPDGDLRILGVETGSDDDVVEASC